jgi:cysteine desulfuration protein SufE
MGKELPEMNEAFKTENFRIKGCQSQVWLYPEFKDGVIYFQADSDALLVKGIIALLVQVYSGETPDAIVEEKEDFLKKLGVTDHLSMNRSNGLAAMTKQIKMYAIAFKSMQGA